MDPQQLDLHPPRNSRDFEDLCCVLWELEWNCPNIQRHGRSGQEQCGVDIFGQPGGLGSYHGIQCKVKSSDGASRRVLTRAEVDREVEQAKCFRPPLEHLIVATTAPEDANLQRYARELSEQHAACGLFAVTVLSWPEIKARLVKHEAILERFYPGTSARLRHLDESLSEIHRRLTFEPELRWEGGGTDRPDESLLSSLVYTARRDPLVGRKNDLAVLWRFLTANDQRFSWLLSVGPGGEGKSRLALELVRRARRQGWHAGKLGRRDLSMLISTEWWPSRPTLMVLDYASQNASDAHQLMVRLLQNGPSFEYDVRILFLDRNAEGPWFTTLVPRNSTGQDILNHNYLKEDDWLKLTPITSENVVKLMRARFHRAGVRPPRSKALLALAQRVDNRYGSPRPLFAAAAAEALIAVMRKGAQTSKRASWAGSLAFLDRAKVFDFLLERDREELWLNRAATDQDLERQRLEKHERILLLSTFALGSLSREALKHNCPSGAREYLPSLDSSHVIFIDFRRLRRMATDTDSEFPTVQPDILGEHYVLRQLETMTAEERQVILEAALRLGGPLASEFIWRCAIDFPERTALIAEVAQQIDDECAQLEFARALVAITTWIDDDLPIALAKLFLQSAKKIVALRPNNDNIKEFTALAAQNLIRKANHDFASRELSWLKDIASVSSAAPDLRIIVAKSTSILVDRFAIQRKIDLVQREVEWLQLFSRRFSNEDALRGIAVGDALKLLNLVPLESAGDILSWLKRLASDELLSSEHRAKLVQALSQLASEAGPEPGANEIRWLIEISGRYPTDPTLRFEAANAVVVFLSQVEAPLTILSEYTWLKQQAVDASSDDNIVTMAAVAVLDGIVRTHDAAAVNELSWLKRLTTDHRGNRDVRLHAATGAAHIISGVTEAEAEAELAWLKGLTKRYPSDYELLVCAILGGVNLIRWTKPERGAKEVKWLRWLADDLPSDENMRFYAAAGTTHLIARSPIDSAQAELRWLKDLSTQYSSETRVQVQSAIAAFHYMTKLAAANRFEEARFERDWIVEQSRMTPWSAEFKQVAAAAQVQLFLDARELPEVLLAQDRRAAAEAAATLLPDCHDGLDNEIIVSLHMILDEVRERYR